MNKITKLLVLLLALVMVVSLFAGCKPTEEKPNQTTGKPNPTQGSQNQNQPTNGASTTIQNDRFPLEEPMTFRMAVRGQKDYQELMEKCEWYKYLCEKTNVFIECVVLGDDYVGTLNTLITADNAPDVVLGPVTLGSSEVIDLAAQGHLVELDDYVTNPAVMPNYQRLLEAVPEALGKMKTPDGHIYSIAGIFGTPGGVWESPLTVNIDFLKQVPGYEDGETFPKTVEEFTEVLRYFKEHDMNDNGDPTDEVPFLMVSTSASGDAQATLQGLMNLWGIGTKDGSNEYYVHIPENDEVTLAPCTENYRDCLKWVNIWYEEGLIWDNFFSKVSSKDLSAVSGAETPMWGFFNGANWFNNGPDMENGNIPWRDSQVIADPFDTGYGISYFMNPALYGNLNNFTIFNTCEDPETLLAWYDLFMSLEGTICVYSGLPNEYERWEDGDQYKEYYEQYPTWYVDEDGKNRFPYLEQAEGWKDLSLYDPDLNDQKNKDHPLWGGIFGLNAVFKGMTPEEIATGQYPNHPYSEAIVLGKWIEDHPDYFDYNIWPRPYSTEEEAEELAFLWPDVKAVITKYETGFITGEIELNDANWDKFQKEMQSAGSEDLIAVLQGMWDRVNPENQ